MSELDEQIEVRRAKRQRLKDAGIATYPHRFDHDAEPADVRAKWADVAAADLEAEPVRLRVPGRIRGIRGQGKIAFVDLHDGRDKLQLLIRPDRLPAPARAVYDNLDLGDFVGAAGRLIRTRSGELSLDVDDLTLLAKLGIDDLVIVMLPTGLVLLRAAVMVDGEQHRARVRAPPRRDTPPTSRSTCRLRAADRAGPPAPRRRAARALRRRA